MGVFLMYLGQGVHLMLVKFGQQRPNKNVAWACVVGSSLAVIAFGYLGIVTIIVASTVMGKFLWGAIIFLCLLGFPLKMLISAIKLVQLAKVEQVKLNTN